MIIFRSIVFLNSTIKKSKFSTMNQKYMEGNLLNIKHFNL